MPSPADPKPAPIPVPFSSTSPTPPSPSTGDPSSGLPEPPLCEDPELLKNGNFAIPGLVGWENWGNATIKDGHLHVGPESGGVGQHLRASVEKAYLMKACARITHPGEGIQLGVKVLDGHGVILVDLWKIVNSTLPQPVSIAFKAPQKAADILVYVWKNPAPLSTGVVEEMSLK